MGPHEERRRTVAGIRSKAACQRLLLAAPFARPRSRGAAGCGVHAQPIGRLHAAPVSSTARNGVAIDARSCIRQRTDVS